MKIETFKADVDLDDDAASSPYTTPKHEFSDDVCSDLNPGEYRLRQLVHDLWDIIRSLDPDYAKRFKRAALAGEVDRVRWLREDPDGTQVCQLLAP